MWEGHDGMGWWMLIGSVWFVIFWGLVIWAVVTVVSKSGGDQSTRTSQDESALDIARKRYARGEIPKEEFERLQEDLR